MSDQSKSAEFSLFDNEEKVIRQAVDLAENFSVYAKEVQGSLHDLVTGYQRSLKEQRRLVRLSDRQQEQMRTMTNELKQEIEQRKLLEEQLKQFNETLEQRVEQEVAKNIEKERMLIHQARHASMGEMIGNIAHQWRQPLTVLNLLIQSIELELEQGAISAKNIQDSMRQALSTIDHMANTINDFKDFFSPEKEKKEFSLLNAAQNAINLLQAELYYADIEAKVICEKDVKFFGHQNELAQVLMNIIGNAKDALIEKGIEFGKIEVTIGSDGKNAFISVLDNAGGIPDEIAQKIFDPYFTTKEEGTGIGLHMTSSIVRDHMGGDISFSNSNGGAKFLISLPL